MNILIIYFAGAALIGLMMYISKNKLVDHLLFIPFIILQVVINVHEYFHLDEVEGEYFKTDKIGFIFLTVLTILSIPTVIHAIIYSMNREETSKETSIHDSALVLFIAMMTGALISNNVGLIWAFVEATTLCSTLLIYHDRSREALEAAWKYVFVCSIGIALAFVGILFLGIASNDVATLNFSITSLTSVAPSMDSTWLKMCFLLILTGYSVKMGIAPLFTVDIDAKDAAPSPIGGIFSGGLLNVGFVAIFRFYEIFSGTEIHPWMNKILLIVGFISILFAAVYILKIRNYTRMLAYSSVEHAGIVLIAIACGGIGYFVAIFHLILHAFTKASLFYQMGQVYRVFRGKSMENVGGYFKLNPYGAATVLLGFFCITAMPPSGLFLTEFLTFKSLLKTDHLYIALTVLVLLTIIVGALGKSFFKLLFTPLQQGSAYYETVSPFESVTQWVLLLSVIYLGINPPVFLVDFIQQSVRHLPQAIEVLHHEII